MIRKVIVTGASALLASCVLLGAAAAQAPTLVRVYEACPLEQPSICSAQCRPGNPGFAEFIVCWEQCMVDAGCL